MLQRMPAYIQLLLATLLCYAGQLAHAHPLAPSLLSINEIDAYHADLLWKEPVKKAKGTNLLPVFSEDCSKTSKVTHKVESNAQYYEWQVACSKPVRQIPITIKGLGKSKSYVLIAYTNKAGNTAHGVVNQSNPVFSAPQVKDRLQNFQYFLTKGFSHFMTGLDHLLFVLGLVLLLMGEWKKLTLAITFFTLGHCLAILSAVMNWFTLAEQAVETLIMISLLWLALELLGGFSGTKRFAIKNHPYSLTFLFGLIHGNGFANALIGSFQIQSDLLLNVLGFNLGLELAQLLAVVISVPAYLWLKSKNHFFKTGRTGLAYLIGGSSVYWLASITF